MRLVTCLCFLLIFLSPGDANVYCYRCHWSKTGEYHDTCSSTHFNPSSAKTEMCTTGCQTETFFEGNDTTMFSRKCADKTVHVDECKMEELTGSYSRRYCYCSSNYCNAVELITSYKLLLLLGIVLQMKI